MNHSEQTDKCKSIPGLQKQVSECVEYAYDKGFDNGYLVGYENGNKVDTTQTVDRGLVVEALTGLERFRENYALAYQTDKEVTSAIELLSKALDITDKGLDIPEATDEPSAKELLDNMKSSYDEFIEKADKFLEKYK